MKGEVVTLIINGQYRTGTVTGQQSGYWVIELHIHPPEKLLVTTEEIERGHL